MSQRYSDEVLAKKRETNRQRFLDKAKSKYGNRFDYSRMQFIRQKVKITLGCPDHGWFEITPDKHLSSSIGCSKCGVIERGIKKQATTKQHFLTNFHHRHGDRLKLVADYNGAKNPITVECLAEGHKIETTPDRLNQFFENGCTVCVQNALWQKQRKTQREFIGEAKEKFPDIDFSITEYKGSFEAVEFICPLHGIQKRIASQLLFSNHGCAVCGKEIVGYAGYRIRRLLSDDSSVKSRPTRIALMRMNIWGIETYKLGITTRTLEKRYREFLVEAYFEAVLDEIDA